MNAVKKLERHLRPGHVYRREDLAKWSAAVDRHVKFLVDEGKLRKLSTGLYYSPKKTVFGEAPANEQDLVAAFLKDDRFLLTSPNAYNSLGVGTTQLYNETVVYNHKRHGHFELGGRHFDFRLKPSFPKASSQEFLVVDLVNNLSRLAEDRDQVLDHVRKLTASLDSRSLLRAAHRYGSVRTKKFFNSVLGEEANRNER